MPIDSPYARDPALLTLGNAIRTARRERGISQEELAHRAGLDRSYMSSVERGTQNAGILTIVQVVLALDMTMTELFAEAML
jgi:transcriptional regulator with XRE-family HTH domain